MKKVYGSLALLLAACVWGFGFVAQSVGMESIGPFTFQSVRCLVGGIALLPVIKGMDSVKKRRGTWHKPTPEETRFLWKGGVLCGLVFTLAACLQQFGLQYTTPAKGGFLTSMYLILVPLLGLFLGRRPPKKIWFCVFIAIVGLYLLSIKEGFTLAPGDGFEVLGALGFAFHIMVIDHYAPHVDGVRLSCIQFFTSAVVAGVPMLLLEHPGLSALLAAGVAIFYAGAISGGVGYTLQIIGQQYAEPVSATLLMSLESVFSMVGGLLILGQVPTGREMLGCVLILAAVILVQLPEKHTVSHEKKVACYDK